MSQELKMRDVFTREAAARVYPAAMGAAIIAREAGKNTLADELMVLAREARYVVRRGKGVTAVGAHVVEPLKAAGVPATFAALAKEIARTDAWAGDSTLVGVIARSDGGVRRVYACKRGKGVAYSVERDILPEAERKAAEEAAKNEAAKAERARRSKAKAAAEPVKESTPKKAKGTAPGKVQQTNIADMPEGTRELVKEAKDAGRVSKEWTEVKTVEWDGSKVRIFARLLGKSVRYGIVPA